MKNKLEPSETAIEQEINQYIPLNDKERRSLSQAISGAKKTQTISIRVQEEDLVLLKRRAQEEAIPYQTLINSVLRRYVRNRLIDESDYLSAKRLMGGKP